MAQRTRKQNLLERLEQESWQLELLVSGFAIFLLLAARGPLEVWTLGTALNLQLSFSGSPLNLLPAVVYGSWFFTTVNLVLHVLLRGLWISAIGLRSVSGGIDLPGLAFRPRFRDFLRPQLFNYDQFIGRLERLCSVLFAYTFLIVFALLSTVLTVVAFNLLSRLLDLLEQWIAPGAGLWEVIALGVYLPLVLSLLAYCVDFLTLGRLKRVRWLAAGYYPFYRLWGWVTLANLYRPLYYNLIDHRAGRRLARLLVPYIIGLILLADLTLPGNVYLPDTPLTGYNSSLVYADERPPGEGAAVSIPGRFTDRSYLPVTVQLSAEVLDVLPVVCPGLRPYRTASLRSTPVLINEGAAPAYAPARLDTLQGCLGQLYRFTLDGDPVRPVAVELQRDPVFDTPALLHVFDLAGLPRGRHVLYVEGAEEAGTATGYQPLTRVVFFVE